MANEAATAAEPRFRAVVGEKQKQQEIARGWKWGKRDEQRGMRVRERDEGRESTSLASRIASARERELLSSFDVRHRYPAKRKSNVPRELSRTISTRFSRKL